MGMSPHAIEIRIDELILHGVAPADRLRIGAALEAELGRLLVERGAPAWFASGGEVEAIDAGAFARGPEAGPAAIGHLAARTVYGGLGA